jgi:hypothetical protein
MKTLLAMMMMTVFAVSITVAEEAAPAAEVKCTCIATCTAEKKDAACKCVKCGCNKQTAAKKEKKEKKEKKAK